MLAGILLRTGKKKRAEELIRKLMPGEAYGAPLALAWCYRVSGEFDRCADWVGKVAEQRHPDAPPITHFSCCGRVLDGLHWRKC